MSCGTSVSRALGEAFSGSLEEPSRNLTLEYIDLDRAIARACLVGTSAPNATKQDAPGRLDLVSRGSSSRAPHISVSATWSVASVPCHRSRSRMVFSPCVSYLDYMWSLVSHQRASAANLEALRGEGEAS